MSPNNVARSRCPTCRVVSWHMTCAICKSKTVIYRDCPKCGKEIWGDNIIVKPDGRSTQCRSCQYDTNNRLRREKRHAK